MANNFMTDLSGITGSAATYTSKHSTSRANNTELKMEDFLQLMIVQLQNQTIDETADTSEMLNQMVQMQMITALTNMTDASLMGYASSLVGKEVTIGKNVDGKLKEEVITVVGTGVSDGQQVIFDKDGNTYALNQIMAVGRLPEIKEPEKPGETDKPVDGTEKPGGTDKPADGTEKPGETDKPVDGTEKPGETDKPVDGTEKPGETDKPVDGTEKPGDDRPVTPEGESEKTPEEDSGNAVDPAAATQGA